MYISYVQFHYVNLMDGVQYVLIVRTVTGSNLGFWAVLSNRSPFTWHRGKAQGIKAIQPHDTQQQRNHILWLVAS